MMPTSLALARDLISRLRGNWHGTYGTAPGPGHPRKDRSLSIRPHSTDPTDVVVHSFAGEDVLAIKDEWRRQGLLPPRSGRVRPQGLPRPTKTPDPEVESRRDLALWLWGRSRPIAGTPADRYLREARGITGELPATLRFLPPKDEHPPALIAPFGLPDEPEPGVLQIAPSAIKGVHLTKLRPDGLGKADVEPNKIMIGRGHTMPIVLAPVNDGLGLAITEGIEDALTIHLATGLGAWAAGAAGRLPAIAEHVPDSVEVVTIFIDADPAGERHGAELVKRLQARGFEVIARPWRSVRYGQA
jgi:hypothetical protein